jgi:hypothetical protein
MVFRRMAVAKPLLPPLRMNAERDYNTPRQLVPRWRHFMLPGGQPRAFRFSLRALFATLSVACLVLAGLVNYPLQTAYFTIWASLTAMAVLAIVGISSALTWLFRSAPRAMNKWWDNSREEQPGVTPDSSDGSPPAR